MIVEKCKICKGYLEVIIDKEGFVIDWYCSKCGLHWEYEDLEKKKIQQNISKYL